MKSHGDEAATNYSFYQVLTHENNSNTTTTTSLTRLRNSCLDSGLYYKHLKSWLRYFPSSKIVLLDGELLRTRPHVVLEHVQRFLFNTTPAEIVNYQRMLVFDKKKGFYCVRRPRNETRTRVCLGASKGRRYDARLDDESRAYLRDFYAQANAKLAKLIRARFSHSQWPSWLNNSI